MAHELCRSISWINTRRTERQTVTHRFSIWISNKMIAWWSFELKMKYNPFGFCGLLIFNLNEIYVLHFYAIPMYCVDLQMVDLIANGPSHEVNSFNRKGALNKCYIGLVQKKFNWFFFERLWVPANFAVTTSPHLLEYRKKSSLSMLFIFFSSSFSIVTMKLKISTSKDVDLHASILVLLFFVFFVQCWTWAITKSHFRLEIVSCVLGIQKTVLAFGVLFHHFIRFVSTVDAFVWRNRAVHCDEREREQKHIL